MATIQDVQGNQFTSESADYPDWRYQYATSSYGDAHDMNPGLIVQPAGKEDIKLAVLYAKANGKRISVRTGGHQYSGASSTGKGNILLDLRTTFQAEDDLVCVPKGDKTFVRASVSHKLGDFNAFLAKNQVFIPHGQCIEVHLGGHVQTGGYGQLGRSFGLLGDYVTSLEIIDHEGREREITKCQDADLFFAWLGGSPGNLGVLTHFTIEVQRDENFVGAMGVRALHFYTPEKLRTLLGYLAQMNDDVDFPRNFDLCISILSASAEVNSWMSGLDNQMEERLPEIYGLDKKNPDWPRTIIVYAQWTPFSKEDKPDMAWFDKLIDGAFFNSGLEKKPMSQLTGNYIFRNSREFDAPYVKRTYVTKSTDLSTNGWLDWVVGRVQEIMKDGNGQWLSAQLQCFGGKNSQLTRNAGNGTAFSWRDMSMIMTLDNFHKPEKKAEAEAWQRLNDEGAIGPNGFFSKEDLRVLWGSWGDFDLNAVSSAYYDKETYERIQKARRVADPEGTFTPNTFAVKQAEC